MEAVGLDPHLGSLHELRPGRPALADDLLEEFRPSVADHYAVTLLARRVLGETALTEAPGGACYLSGDGRRQLPDARGSDRAEVITHPLLARTISRSALAVTLTARHLRGDLPVYPPYVLPT